MRYAAQTGVSTDRSREEIQKILMRYGADGFMYGMEGARAVVGFKMKNKLVQFALPLPDPKLRDFTHTPGRGKERHPDDAMREWEQACRQRWRALALSIKAKMEAVECGITTFEQEFLAHIVIPGMRGATVGQMMVPKIEQAYLDGKTPSLILGMEVH